MRQFDLYENPDSDSRAIYPFFVDVQTDLLDDLNSRVVIPISPVQDTKTFPKNLCPTVEIDDDKVLVSAPGSPLSRSHPRLIHTQSDTAVQSTPSPDRPDEQTDSPIAPDASILQRRKRRKKLVKKKELIRTAIGKRLQEDDSASSIDSFAPQVRE